MFADQQSDIYNRITVEQVRDRLGKIPIGIRRVECAIAGRISTLEYGIYELTGSVKQRARRGAIKEPRRTTRGDGPVRNLVSASRNW
jgi:hypothetical protein